MRTTQTSREGPRQPAGRAHEVQVPFVREDVEQGDDVFVAKLLEKLDLAQRGDVDALWAHRRLKGLYVVQRKERTSA